MPSLRSSRKTAHHPIVECIMDGSNGGRLTTIIPTESNCLIIIIICSHCFL